MWSDYNWVRSVPVFGYIVRKEFQHRLVEQQFPPRPHEVQSFVRRALGPKKQTKTKTEFVSGRITDNH
jgi:hypothetical protein